jgi:GMP synthase (glutamine-hydrolysing)
LLGLARQGAIVAIENVKARMYGLQYHPEVMHTDQGTETLRHFLFEIAKLKKTWKMEDVLEQLMAKVAAKVPPPLPFSFLIS